MRYAIISDVHGNLPALNAVLKDAKEQNIDKYIFVGDYSLFLQHPNEVIEIIKIIKNSYVIKGNTDILFEPLPKQDKSKWTDGQFQTLYWCFRNISKENLIFLRNLPTQLIIDISSERIINISHSSRDIVGTSILDLMSNTSFELEHKKNNINRQQYILKYKEEILLNSDFQASLQKLQNGIYIFGHTHFQWHIESENKIFINPGSCGMPLDGEKTASYTILEINDDIYKVEEKRIFYDVKKVISDLKKSELYIVSNVMSNIVIESLNTGIEQLSAFLEYAENYAKKVNDNIRPYTKKLWESAYRNWKNK